MPKHASIRPLKRHPELEVISTQVTGQDGQPKHVEYRVYNYRSLNSGRVLRGDTWGLLDGVIVAALIRWIGAKYVHALQGHRIWLDYERTLTAVLYTILAIWTFKKCQTVLYQSVIPLPSFGLQLSTTRGLSFPNPTSLSHWHATPTFRMILSISTSQTFIPLSDISTVIINEGLSRWSVRYYLAIVKKGGEGVLLSFDEVRPRHPVLREVYHGVRESLFDEWASDDIGDSRLTQRAPSGTIATT